MKVTQVLAALLPTLGVGKTEVFEGYFVDAVIDPDDNDFAIFQVQMKQNQWFGLGLGTRDMSVDSDMIIIDSDERKVYDMHSAGNRVPIEDDSQDL